jgi:hypothetical protein
MASATVIEFLNENARRSYPLRRGSSLDTGLVLDFRGFSRGMPKGVLVPRIISIKGAAVSDSGFVEVWVATGTCTIESASVEAVVKIIINSSPINGVIYGYGSILSGLGINSSLDPESWEASSLWTSVSMSFGADLVSEIDGNEDSTLSEEIEPSLFLNTWRGDITGLLVVNREEDPPAYLFGDIFVEMGRNLTAETVIDGSLLSLEASPRSGLPELSIENFLLQEYPLIDEADLMAKCESAVRSINGIGPSPSGAFKIEGAAGVQILNYPSSHQIVIRVTSPAESPACAEPYVEPIGDQLWELDGDDDLRAGPYGPQGIDPGQGWYIDANGDLTPSEDLNDDLFWQWDENGDIVAY